MADELDKALNDGETEGKNKIEERFTELSSKVKKTAEERDEEKRLREEQKAENEKLKRELEFSNQFSDMIPKFSGASQFRDKIREKVLAGYSVEDATVSVLNREGKLSTPEQERDNIAGGSASTSSLPKGGGKKSLSEMNRNEMREALIEAENEGGAITRILERKSLA